MTKRTLSREYPLNENCYRNRRSFRGTEERRREENANKAPPDSISGEHLEAIVRRRRKAVQGGAPRNWRCRWQELTSDQLYKIWPKQPLAPGEYSVAEFTSGQMNMQI